MYKKYDICSMYMYQNFANTTYNVLRVKFVIIGASLSEPHIDHDNIPRAQNNANYLSIYVSFTPRLSHPGSRDPCTS